MSPSEQELVIDHMKLVYYLVNKHFSGYPDHEDLLQVGMSALCDAAIKWSPDTHKCKFSTFAGQVIRNQLHYYLRSTTSDRGKSDVTLVSLDQKISDEAESLTIGEIVGVTDEWESVDTDYQIFKKSLSQRQQQVADCLKGGRTVSECAKEMGLSAARVYQIIKRVKHDWGKFYADKD